MSIRKARLAASLAALLPAGCTTIPQHIAQEGDANRASANSTARACYLAVVNKPEYALLMPRNPDPDTQQHSESQLRDSSGPTRDEAQLLASRFYELLPCKTQFLEAVSRVRPDLVQLNVAHHERDNEIDIFLIERIISWGGAAQRRDADTRALHAELQEADQQSMASVDRGSPSAQRHAAARALAEWSELQQQMVAAPVGRATLSGATK